LEDLAGFLKKISGLIKISFQFASKDNSLLFSARAGKDRLELAGRDSEHPGSEKEIL